MKKTIASKHNPEFFGLDLEKGYEPNKKILGVKPQNPQATILKVLKKLKPVEYPSRSEINAERQKFISLLNEDQSRAVSPLWFIRIKQWIRQPLPRISFGSAEPRKERYLMKTALIRIVLILGITLSLATGTIASAQNSLPDSPLYDAKLKMEQLHLGLLQDPAKLAEQHLVLAQNRVKEMVAQSLQGEIPDQGLVERLQQHLAYSLHYAAQVQGSEMAPILEQAQNMAINQHQILSQIQAQVGGSAGEPLGLAAQIMSQFSFQLAFGLGNPEAFRSQHQNGPNMDSLQTAGTKDCVPIGDENKYGPQPGGSAGPGEKYGNPDCEQCVPAGDEHKYGQQSEGTLNYDSDCQECVPAGDENKYGPQPSQPGPGEAGGNPDCPDCDPDGDKNQNGPQPGEPPGSGAPGGNPDCPDCDCLECDPDGDKNQNGPQPSEPPGSGDPGGNPDCPDCDCPNCDCQNCDCPDCTCCDPDCDQSQNGEP